MKKYAVVLAGLVMMVFSSNLKANSINHTIKGKIINNTNSVPISGAGIIIKEKENIVATITDEDGNFVLLNVSSGVHYIQVKQNGFEDKIIKIVVNGNSEQVVNVALNKTIDNQDSLTKEDTNETKSNSNFYQLFVNPQLNFNLLKSMIINF